MSGVSGSETASRSFEAFSNTADGIVWEANAELAFTFVSPQAESLLGFPPERWLHDPQFGWSLFRSKDRERILRLRPDPRSGTASDSFECRLASADGGARWFKHLVTAQQQNGSGRILQGILIDITSLKEAERCLRESEENYRQILETAQEGVWRIDAAGKTTFVNQMMAEMLGFLPEEMSGRSVFDFMDEEGQRQTTANLERRRRGIRERHDFVFRRKDGSRVWTTLSTNPLYDDDGQYCGALAVATDISPLRKSNVLLAAQKGIFESLIHRGPNALTEALAKLVLAIEESIDDVVGLVLLLDDEGKRVLVGAAPNLPQAYSAAIHGVEIGPTAGSCGTAAFRNELVVTADTYTDPLWADYRELAKRHELRACWSNPICDRNRKVLGTFAMYFRTVRRPTEAELQLVRDATSAAALAIEHVRTQGALERTISLLHATIESTADGLLVVDLQGNIQRYNRRFLELWQIPESLAVGRDDAKLLSFVLDQLTDPEGFQSKVRTVYADPEAVTFDVVEFKDGRVFERYSQAQKIGDVAVGRVWGFRDVTARVRAERARIESEERFRALADAAFEGIALHEQGVIRLANEGMAKIFGYELPELIGMNVSQLAAPETREAVLRSIQSTQDAYYESVGLRKDGSRVFGEIRSRQTEYQGRPARVVSILDTTARRELQAEREQGLARERQARIEAERLVKLHDDFLAIASHELKTPLTPLKLYLQLLRHTMREVALPATRQTQLLLDALDNTDREYNRLLGLIDDLLLVSRITAGRLAVVRERCELSRIVLETATQLVPEFERAKCEVTMALAPNVEGNWDRRRIEQVASNLLSNAMKYGAGSPVEIKVEKQNGVARLTVRDHGIGIAPENHEKIFDRFVRVAPIQHYGGLGLGLFIVRQILTAHDGKVSVTSTPAEGSCFVVELPLLGAGTAIAPANASNL